MRYVLPGVLLLAALLLAGCGADTPTATPVVIVVTATPAAPAPPTAIPSATAVPASATPDAAATAAVLAQATAEAEDAARAALAVQVQATQTEEARPTATAVVPPTATPVPTLKDQVVAVLAGTSYAKTIFNVQTDADGSIGIAFHVQDNFTQDMIGSGAKIEITDLLKALHTSNITAPAVLFLGYFPQTDTFGNTKNQEVIEAGYSQATLDQVNWGNFSFRNIYKIADHLVLDPQFQE